MKRICSLYVSEWHLATMLLPYINKNINEEIVPILETNFEEYIKKLLESINLNEGTKQKILNIGWEAGNFKKNIGKIIEAEKEIYLIVYGSKEYIEETNNEIYKWVCENKHYIEYDKINIVNCYEVQKYNDIKEVLENHDKILNTSGEKDIVKDSYETQKIV